MEKDDHYVEDDDNLAVQIWIYQPCNETLEVWTLMMRARQGPPFITSGSSRQSDTRTRALWQLGQPSSSGGDLDY